ncbi:unnamed protein product [Coffea canephora]|uniref:Uncharacterized protein n=1 Tax=Coffea canephora TaxID=49390 RepID=A0A068UBE8_COFCA|nr:unnamed protein product [Coffea canephora]
MEVFGKSMLAVPTNVIYLSSILGQDGPDCVHKCDWKCENEHICGNIVSRKIFPLTAAEEQAVKGVRRKLDAESSAPDSCAFKRRRDAQFQPSPFERSFSAVGPICSQVGDGMDMS